MSAPFAAITIRAWTVMPEAQGNPRYESVPVRMGDWEMTADGVAMGATSPLLHKGMIFVLVSNAAERPERRNVLHIYTVKRKSSPNYVRDPETGQPMREAAYYPDLVGRACVRDGFTPIEPFDAFAAPAHGADLTLVEG